MTWAFMFGAIVCEVFGTTCMKLSDGFTRPLPAAGMALGYCGAFGLLTLALKQLPVGVAYATWAGVGTGLVALVGVALLGEPLSAAKIAGVGLVIAGVVVLNLGGAH
ncbi:multidrug efflux SMR transporter [Nocardia terpenica]|uniref:Multidrug resistance protein Mmr n=1 Tax=Nocardia terpenica TaxID=455432 RepID=A0A164LWU9_9NOCA|nr:multidrug efflux SMR transporter [Nocardia terpenica]KZM72823.1 ligand-binding protein SH3 [Nocardia terpenica]MBF6061270.1 multidrug efflux SMR transporter [Nocardia terpenica]MBF6105501.1 multidrug efflux SMR transporter [Nocardia terpenica]MBF6113029.1 multidrug efflux SMR transporter [Nocardia terpenica]MBF6119159.1 multidrug efflux SMR transporter [Nocardia terpenica]